MMEDPLREEVEKAWEETNTSKDRWNVFKEIFNSNLVHVSLNIKFVYSEYLLFRVIGVAIGVQSRFVWRI